jgi:hypothetical protein
MLLSTISDEAIVNWIIGLGVAFAGVTIPAIYALWRKLINFVKPMIVALYENFLANMEAHKKLVTTLDSTIGQIVKTQDNQTSMIKALDERHVATADKLDTATTKIDHIMEHLKVQQR